MANNTNTKDMERAQAAFHKKETQRREGAQAMAEYQAHLTAERAKTEKLRALRLARDAAEGGAAEAAAPQEIKPAAKKPKKSAARKNKPAPGGAGHG